MKTYLLIIFSLLMLAQSQAQNFAPVGAKFYYSIGALESTILPSMGYTTIDSKGDTIIEGQSVRKLVVNRINSDKSLQHISMEFMLQSGDTISYFNPYQNKFVPLYNFALQPSDTMIVHNAKQRVTDGFFIDSVDRFIYIIDSIDSVHVNNQWLKRQNVRYYKNTDWGIVNGVKGTTQIIENYGALTYMFGYTSGVTPETKPTELRCVEFNDSTIFKNGLIACDYTYHVNGLVKDELNDLTVYPNPITNEMHITIGNHDKPITFTMYNSVGQIVKTFSGGSGIYSVDELPAGVYFLKFSTSTLTQHKMIRIIKL